MYKASGNEPAVEEGEEQEVELDCMRKWWVPVGKEQGERRAQQERSRRKVRSGSGVRGRAGAGEAGGGACINLNLRMGWN